jgi:glycosyltransferase involved in cell wall biosynthesis
VADAVRHAETGLLVEPGDVEAAASAMLRLLTEPELARKMGKANREWAETLTWERYAAEQVQAYQELLGRDRL